MRLLITRPEPDASKLAGQLHALGHETIIEPLMRVEYLKCDILLNGVQALIFTSRNALRWVEDQENKRDFIDLPIFSVGPATTKKARELGFREICEGAGTAEDLVEAIKAHADMEKGLILHLSGREVAVDILPKLNSVGLCVKRVIVYDTVPASRFSDDTIEAIKEDQLDGVILMSPKTAKIWVNLIEQRHDIVSGNFPTAFCISTAVAEPLKRIKNVSNRIARKPNIEEMLALIEEYTKCPSE